MKKRKILSLGLILALVITLIPLSSAKAAADYIYVKGSAKSQLTQKSTRNIYVGGKRIDLDYKVNGRSSGAGGKWSSSDTKVIKVSQKGSCVAAGNGNALISYTYKKSGKTYIMSTNLKAGTKASAVALRPSTSTDMPAKVTMKPNSPMKFSAAIIPNPNAVKVNSAIQSTYTVYYELFSDAACTTKLDGSIATMSADGVVIPIKEATVYLRAQARSAETSTVGNINSNVITLVIGTDAAIVQSGYNTFSVTADGEITLATVSNKKTGKTVTASISYPEAGSKNKAVITTNTALTADEYIVSIFIGGKDTKTETILCQSAVPTRLDISSPFAALDKLAPDATSGYPTASVSYKIYDQFGNDITSDSQYGAGTVSAVCTGNTSVSSNVGDARERGVVKFSMGATPLINSTMEVTVYYAGNVNNKPVFLTDAATVSITAPSQVRTIEVKGIYSYDYINGYVKWADENSNTLVAGKTIADFGGNVSNNKTPGAYYLLLRATDTNGNPVNQSGVKQETVATFVKNNSGLDLDTVLVDGAEVHQSIEGIVIDGVKYLTYPLKAAALKEGSSTFILSGISGTGSVREFTLTIAKTVEVASFLVSTTKLVYPGEFTYLDYEVKNTAGNTITNYDTLIALTSSSNTGTIGIIPASTIKSEFGSVFQWEKQADGSAKLKYLPNLSVLLKSTGFALVGEDIIKSFAGSPKEGISKITVYSLDTKKQ